MLQNLKNNFVKRKIILLLHHKPLNNKNNDQRRKRRQSSLHNLQYGRRRRVYLWVYWTNSCDLLRVLLERYYGYGRTT